MATPSGPSVLYRALGAGANSSGSGAIFQGPPPLLMPGTGHPLASPPPLHLPCSDYVRVPLLILKSRSHWLCSVLSVAGPQCSLIPRMPTSIIKFAAVNGVSRQGKDIQLPGPLLILNETKKWSCQVRQLNLIKAFWKKPAFLYVLSGERTSRTLLVILKNPLMHWDAFSGSKV